MNTISCAALDYRATHQQVTRRMHLINTIFVQDRSPVHGFYLTVSQLSQFSGRKLMYQTYDVVRQHCICTRTEAHKPQINLVQFRILGTYGIAPTP